MYYSYMYACVNCIMVLYEGLKMHSQCTPDCVSAANTD